MTQTLGTNSSGDIYLGSDGNLVMLSDLAAIEAACATATLAQLGEMVLATTTGIPNFQALWIGTPEYALWKSYILNALQNVPGVQQVTSLTLSVNGNTVSYIANITTQFGTATVTNAVSQAGTGIYTTEDGSSPYTTEDGSSIYTQGN